MLVLVFFQWWVVLLTDRSSARETFTWKGISARQFCLDRWIKCRFLSHLASPHLKLTKTIFDATKIDSYQTYLIAHSTRQGSTIEATLSRTAGGVSCRYRFFRFRWQNRTALFIQSETNIQQIRINRNGAEPVIMPRIHRWTFDGRLFAISSAVTLLLAAADSVNGRYFGDVDAEETRADIRSRSSIEEKKEKRSFWTCLFTSLKSFASEEVSEGERGKHASHL